MPIYIYQNPESGETKEVFQKMKDEHVFKEDGVEWKRVFVSPMASISSNTPETKAEFMDVTSKKRGTLGDMMDLSSEMSQKRAEKYGEDPVRKKYFEDHKKEYGIKHVKDTAPFSKNGVTVDYK